MLCRLVRCSFHNVLPEFKDIICSSQSLQGCTVSVVQYLVSAAQYTAHTTNLPVSRGLFPSIVFGSFPFRFIAIGLCNLDKSHICLHTAFLHPAREYSLKYIVVVRHLWRCSVASPGLVSSPATLVTRLHQLSNFRLQSNVQHLERHGTKPRVNMIFTRCIHTAAFDTATQYIIPTSSVVRVCMCTEGPNFQFRINGHSATNMLKTTWPILTPIKIQS